MSATCLDTVPVVALHGGYMLALATAAPFGVLPAGEYLGVHVTGSGRATSTRLTPPLYSIA